MAEFANRVYCNCVSLYSTRQEIYLKTKKMQTLKADHFNHKLSKRYVNYVKLKTFYMNI